jgi:hypothetical protein
MCLAVLGRHIPQLEFLDILFGDQAPLTPAQTFYQRALIGSSEQLMDQADQCLKEKSLLTYYDEVALAGLKLAQLDARRGVIENDRIQKIRDTVQQLVADLADYDDGTPPQAKENANNGEEKNESAPDSDLEVVKPEQVVAAWKNDAAVVCIAGRGPLDEPITAMLAQILTKHGINAIAATKATFFSSIPVEGTKSPIACLSYLDVDYASERLRHSVLVLERRMPEAKILLGLWGRSGDRVAGEDLGIDVGADFYALSLRDTVRICLDEATGKSVPAGNVVALKAAPAPRRKLSKKK